MLNGILVWLAVAGGAPIGRPIYLECTLANADGTKQPWSVTVDEGNQTVTYTSMVGLVTLPAAFTGERVEWGNSAFKASIDRQTLSFIHDFYRGDGSTSHRTGRCKLSSQKRIF